MLKEQKGITLVALVITIIVLVILVGVTLSVAINSGLINNAKKAVKDYNTVQANESDYVNNVADQVNDILNDKNITK